MNLEKNIKIRHAQPLLEPFFEPLKAKLKELSQRILNKFELNVAKNQANHGLPETQKTLKVQQMRLVYLIEFHEEIPNSDSHSNGEPWLIGTENC